VEPSEPPIKTDTEKDFPGLIGSLSQVGGELGQQLLKNVTQQAPRIYHEIIRNDRKS